MRRLILHIGTEKTGTTSIQGMIVNAQQFLESKSIYTSSSLRNSLEGNHRWLSLFFLDHAKLLNDDMAISRHLHHDNIKEKIIIKKKEFEGEVEIRSESDQTWLLSSEHLQSRLNTQLEVNKLKDYLSNIFDDIKIILYFRDPSKLLPSILSTNLRNGATGIDIMEYINNAHFEQLCAYKKTCQQWGQAFGVKNLIVRRYDRQFLQDGDVVLDFLQCCNINSDGLPLPPKQNTSLSFTAMNNLAYLNSFIPKYNSDGVNRLRGNLDVFIEQAFSDGTRLLFSNDNIDLCMAKFANDNHWLKNNYYPKDDALWPRLEQRSNLECTSTLLPDMKLIDVCSLKAIQLLWTKSRRLELQIKNKKIRREQ